MRTARLNRAGSIAAIALVVALVLAPAAVAKKKRGGTTFRATTPVEQVIPNNTLDGPDGVLTSTVQVPKRFERIRDVNVTVQTTGQGPEASDDMTAKLTAPNGAMVVLFTNLSGIPLASSVSVGPLTLDDEAGSRVSSGIPDNPFRLYHPWAGRTRPQGKALSVMDDADASGTWTLTMLDETGTGTTSILNSWSLEVKTGKPYLAGKSKRRRFNATMPVNGAVPDAVGDVDGVLTSTIQAPAKLRGLVVRDVNFTVKTSGVADNTADDIRIYLTAPNRAFVPALLFSLDSFLSPSIGPLTFDDEARLDLAQELGENPTELGSPWIGSVTPNDLPLAAMDHGPVNGTWTLTVIDGEPGQVSTLDSWSLDVKTGRPFQAKGSRK